MTQETKDFIGAALAGVIFTASFVVLGVFTWVQVR